LRSSRDAGLGGSAHGTRAGTFDLTLDFLVVWSGLIE